MEQMYDKKIEIINASIHLFSKKGFASTSVQDIATYCNISKATIYKFFKSKEEILIHIIQHVNKKMFIEVENINSEFGDSNCSTLEKKLAIFFKHLYSRKNFTVMIYENQSLLKNPKFEAIILENRRFVLDWYRNILLEEFGDKIRNIVWDVVLSTAGIIKEFNYVFLVKETLPYDFKKIAHFITKSLNSLIECHYKDEPLVSPESFELFDNNIIINKELLVEEWDKCLLLIQNKLDSECELCNKTNILDAISELTKEIKKASPRSFLIDSLFLYLSKFKLIDAEVLFLKGLYIKSGI